VSEAKGGGIFLSYRRQDSSHVAGRLYDRFVERFGKGRAFMDVDTMEPGVDFAEAIARAVETCEVLLAIIGPGWLTAKDQQDRRRLEDPDDIVRLEVEAALARDVRVIPILVENAVMPNQVELPETLVGLARRHAFVVRHESFQSDVERLITSIESVTSASTAQGEWWIEKLPWSKVYPQEFCLWRGRKEIAEAIRQLSGEKVDSVRDAHELKIKFGYLGQLRGSIMVDGQVLVKERNIHGKIYPLRALGSELGSDVTIQVHNGFGGAHIYEVKLLILKIGDQIVRWPTKS
jgi:hypothetical protein